MNSLWRRDHSALGINRRNLDLVFADHRPRRFRDLDDKLLAKDRLTAAGIPVPKTLGVLRHAPSLAEMAALLQPLSEVVIKPVKGWGGRGILVLHREGERWLTPSGDRLSLETIASHVGDIVSGLHSLDESEDGALLEERLHADAIFDRLGDGGLPDLRIVVERGEPIQAMCRVPTAASGGKANLHSGGLGIGIDIARGVTTGGRWKGRLLEQHPDCDVALIGIEISHWPRILEIARAADRALGLSYLGVDLVLDRDRGPLVLEVNARPGLEIQTVNQAPQPVRTRTLLDAFDRLTLRFAWFVLALMAVGPLVFESWRPQIEAAEVVRLLQPLARDAPEESGETESGEGVEWASEEIPVSSTNEPFRLAKQASEHGDLDTALRLYRVAADDDPTVAPFAYNNIGLLLREQGRLEEARQAMQHALAQYPDYFRALYNLGLVYLGLKDYDAAQQSFERALAQRPTHAASWAGLGGVHFARRDFAAAIEAYDQAIRFAPPTRAYRVRQGLALRLRGELTRASERFAEAWTLDPGHEPAAYWWARTVMEQNSVPADSVAVVLAPHLKGHNASARCRSLAADAAWRTGQFTQSWALLQQLVSRGYRSSFHRKGAAALALELGLFDAAAAHLDRLPEEERDFTHGHLELAALGSLIEDPGAHSISSSLDVPGGSFQTPIARWLYEAWTDRAPRAETAPDRLPRDIVQWLLDPSRDLALAWGGWPEDPGRTSLEARLEVDDPLPTTLLLWFVARRAEHLGQADVAHDAIAALREIAPHYYPLEQRRLRAALSTGDKSTARELARGIRRLWREDPENTLVLARLYADEGRGPRAAALIDQLSTEQQRTVPVRTLRARILLDEGHTAEARRALRQIVSEAPEDVQARVALADAYRARGEAKKAVEQLRMAIDLAPARVNVRRDLGRALMDARQYDEAAKVWRRAISLDPGHEHDSFNLALSLQRAGDLQGAIVQYDLLLAEDPTRYKAWFNRSLALEDLGRTADAQAGYERVLSLRPDHGPTLRKLGRVTRGG